MFLNDKGMHAYEIVVYGAQDFAHLHTCFLLSNQEC